MKQMKRMLAVLLAVMMLTGAVGVSALADAGNEFGIERYAALGDSMGAGVNAASGQSHIAGEVAALRLGDALFVTAPVEPLSAIGRRIKSFSEKQVFFIGYANGYMHYGAPAEAYNNGGYETIECLLGSGWQAVYEDAVRELMADLP